MKRTAILTALLGLALGPLQAQTPSVPLFINYQGNVTQSNGTPLGSGSPENRKIIFRIFASETGGNPLWSEEQTVTISAGQFSVLLGRGIQFLTEPHGPIETVFTSAACASPEGPLRFLGITVDEGGGTLDGADVPISPRQQITTTAYSFRARAADTIASGTSLVLNDSNDYGLGWYGTGRTFNSTPIDGPVLYGLSGGALGSVSGATQTNALRWNAAGQVGIGSATLSNTAATTKLVVQGDDTGVPSRQLSIRGKTNENQRLLLGYRTNANEAHIQSYSAAATTSTLNVNGSGGILNLGSTSADTRALGGIHARTAYGTRHGFSFNGDSDTGMYRTNTNKLSFYTAGADRLAIASNGAVSIPGSVSAGSFTGSGSGVTSLNASNLTSGSVNDARLSANIPRKNATNTFTANNTFTNVGVGTAPSVPLHVKSSGGGHATALRFETSLGTSEDWYFYMNANDDYVIRNDTSNYFTIQKDTGRVGIGTTNPQAKLDVVGTGNIVMNPAYRYFGPHGSDTSVSGQTFDTSIRADRWIASYAYVSYSDRRIKRDIVASATPSDLKAIEQLRVADYRMVDHNNGPNPVRKGFIAQEVEKVIPAAVSRSVQFVPDIFAGAENVLFNAAAKTLTLALAKDHGLKAGDRVRLHMDGKRSDLTVSAVPSPREFVVEECESAPEKVLVYGKEVNDFRRVDYDRIFTTAVGALQELKKEKDTEVAVLQEENAALRTRLESQEKRLVTLEAKDDARDAKLAAIEKVLSTRKTPDLRVSLQQRVGTE